VHNDPTGACGQQPRRLAMVAQPFDALGGDHDLDADVAHALGQVDRRVHPGGQGRELVQGQQDVFA